MTREISWFRVKWIATSFLYGSFIRYFLPVLTVAFTYPLFLSPYLIPGPGFTASRRSTPGCRATLSEMIRASSTIGFSFWVSSSMGNKGDSTFRTPDIALF